MSDGKVQMCCHQTYRFIGSLFENSFEDIWLGDLAKDIRLQILEDKLHEHCRTSECPFRYKIPKKKTFKINKNGLPTELEFDLHPSHCNYGGVLADPQTTCVMCPRNAQVSRNFILESPDQTEMLADKVKHIVPYLCRMCIMGISEPFWKNKMFEVMDIFDFDRYKDKILFWTNTNGSLCNQEAMKVFANRTKRTCLQFSLDAATEETYLKIRRNKVWNKVVSNLREWSLKTKKLNRKEGVNHEVVIANNINLLNVKEMSLMVEMAKELQVDRLHFTGTHDMGGSNNLSHILPSPDNYKMFSEFERRAKKRANQLGVVLTFGGKPIDGNMQQKLVQISLC